MRSRQVGGESLERSGVSVNVGNECKVMLKGNGWIMCRGFFVGHVRSDVDADVQVDHMYDPHSRVKQRSLNCC